MEGYGIIQIVVNTDKVGNIPRTRGIRVKIHDKFIYRGYKFLVHKSTRFEGWVVSEERSGAIASTRKPKDGVENKTSSHISIKEAINQAKDNLDKFLADGNDFDILVGKLISNILIVNNTYIELIKKKLI